MMHRLILMIHNICVILHAKITYVWNEPILSILPLVALCPSYNSAYIHLRIGKTGQSGFVMNFVKCDKLPPAPLKLRSYGAIEIRLLLLNRPIRTISSIHSLLQTAKSVHTHPATLTHFRNTRGTHSDRRNSSYYVFNATNLKPQ